MDGCNYVDRPPARRAGLGPARIRRRRCDCWRYDYRFVNTHLEVEAGGPIPGEIQAAQAYQLLDTVTGVPAPGRRLVIVGDMNSSPNDPAVEPADTVHALHRIPVVRRMAAPSGQRRGTQLLPGRGPAESSVDPQSTHRPDLHPADADEGQGRSPDWRGRGGPACAARPRPLAIGSFVRGGRLAVLTGSWSNQRAFRSIAGRPFPWRGVEPVMLKSTAKAIRDLLDEQRVLSLAVIVDGAPYAGLLPFVVLPGYAGVMVHASRLSKHTKGLGEGAPAGVLLHEQYAPGKDALQIKRATFECAVRPLVAQERRVGRGARLVSRAIPRQPHHVQPRRLHAVPARVPARSLRRRIRACRGHRARRPAEDRDAEVIAARSPRAAAVSDAARSVLRFARGFVLRRRHAGVGEVLTQVAHRAAVERIAVVGPVQDAFRPVQLDAYARTRQ